MLNGKCLTETILSFSPQQGIRTFDPPTAIGQGTFSLGGLFL